MKQYWAVVEGKMSGPYEIPELVALPGFTTKISVFVSGQDEWKEAIEFPAITRFLKSGELPDDLDMKDGVDKKISAANWREAIVPSDIEYPELKAVPTGKGESGLLYHSRRTAPKAAKKFLNFSVRAALNRQWQKVLLLVLGVTLYGTYQPAINDLPTVIDGMTSEPAVIAPKATHQVRQVWHRIQKLSIRQSLFVSRKNAALALANPGSTPVVLKPGQSQVVEEDSSPLPDGMVMKTVTTVQQVNGVKVYKTKTFIAAPEKVRHKK